MKMMKKLLALTIVFAMSLSVVAFAGYNDVDINADYAGAVELLSALEIFEGDDLGNFNPEKTITRAEMAAIICRAKGLENSALAAKGATSFVDVAADHWASGYINIASQNGIIAGYGNNKFGPEDTLTYDQAVKMVMCALGFEPMAAAKGGWPTGYLVVANTYNVTEGVSDATRGDIAILLSNALSTPMMDQTSWGADAEFEVLNGKNGKEYRTLLTDMDIYIATGIVGDKDSDEVEFDVSDDSDDGEFEYNDEVYFKINGTDIVNYKHQSVDAYVRKTSRNKYETVAVVSAVVGSSFTIISDDIESFDGTKINYYVNSATSSKTKTIKIDDDAKVEYNTTNYTGSLASLLLQEDDVELTFIENTGDKTYDAIVATKYVSARVDYVDAARDKIAIDGTTVTLDFDDDEVTIILQDMEGNELSLHDFEEDDVVAVIADNDKIRDYIDYIKIVKLDRSVVRGTVDGTFTSNGNPYVIIDGEEYVDDSSKNLSVGDEGLFFIGMTGKIIDFDGSSVVKDYAYILECALSTQNFSDDLWQVKLLTAEDGIVTYTLNDDANDYFVETYAAMLGIDVSNDTKQLYSTLTNAEKADPDRLITYKTNSRGYIKSFKGANTYGTTVRELSSSSHKYNDYTQIIGGATLEDNVVIFNLSNSSADNAYTTDITYLTHDSKYSGFAFANEDYEYCVMVITSGDSSFDPDAGIAIVTKKVDTKDKEENEIVKVTFVQDETEGAVYFDEDSENKAGSDTAYENLTVGDVFAYNADASGCVSEYVVLGNVRNGLLSTNSSAYGYFDEDTEFLYGYIANSERRKTSKGETITIYDGNENTISIASASNKYTYNDAGRNIVIETEDFMAEDAYYYDAETGEATFAFVKMSDGFVTDIYTFNKRVNVAGAVNVEMLIKAIGTVDDTCDDCLAKIETAERAYESLSNAEKGKVSNYSVLVAARSTYDALKAEADAAAKEAEDREKAATVIAAIDAIGTVDLTDACKTKIEAAEAAFTALTADQKEYVTNYSVLTDARGEYDRLYEEAQSQQKVTNVIALINAIGNVDSSAECKAKIDDARAAYDALDAAEQDKVNNYETLTNAEAAYDALVSTAAVGEVILLIDSIGEVEPTDECKEKIDSAEDAYGKLTQTEKDRVTNADELVSAKSEYTSSVANVANVKALIEAIGTVAYTSDCAAKIEAANSAYKALATAEKYAVTNYSKLAEAQIAYEALEKAAKAAEKEAADKAEAAKVEALISAIGAVDASDASKAKIDAAEKAYADLTADQKAYVTNSAKIADAKSAYNAAVEAAKIAADKAEAAKVEALISAIGTVAYTDASKVKIDAAEKAYTDLTATQKTYVTNYAVLTSAKTAYAKLEAEAKVAADKAEAAKVEALIKGIGTVDASDACKAKIDAADKAYTALTATQKTYVTNYAVLTAAKTSYAKALELKKIAEAKLDPSKIEAAKISLPKTEVKKIDGTKLEAAKIAPATK